MNDPLSLPSMPFIQKRLTLRGWPSGTAEDSKQTVEFAMEQGVKCQVERFGLEDADKAYEQYVSVLLL